MRFLSAGSHTIVFALVNEVFLFNGFSFFGFFFFIHLFLKIYFKLESSRTLVSPTLIFGVDLSLHVVLTWQKCLNIVLKKLASKSGHGTG